MAVAVKWVSIAAAKDLTDTSVNPDAAPTSTPRQGGFTLRNRINFDNVSAANKKLWNIDDATLNDDTINKLRILEVPERVFVKNVTITGVKDETQPMFDLDAAKASNASVHASDLSTAYLLFGADRNKKPTSHASYAAASDLVPITTVNAEGPDMSIEGKGGEEAYCVFGKLDLKIDTTDASHPSASLASLDNVVFEDTFKKIDSSIASSGEALQTAKRPYLQQTYSASAITGASSAWNIFQEPRGEYFPYGGFVTMMLGPVNTSIASGANAAAAYYASDTAAVLEPAGVWEIQAECLYVPE